MLLALLPDDALVLVIMGVGFALMIGLLSRGAAFRILGTVLLLVALGPMLDPLIDLIPWWAQILILAGIALAVLQALAAVFIGRLAAAHMVGILAADVVRFVFRALFAPVRWVFRI
jgi:hypothetical protein